MIVAVAGIEALEGNPISYPAADNHVIAVAATDKNDVRGSFSNYGSYVDIAAPGVEILSTIPKSLSSANTGDTNSSGYTAWDGTSMATPFVSGVVSLLLSLKPTLTFSEIENILYTTAKDLGTPSKDDYYGWGRVQPFHALQSVSTTPPPSASKVLISQFATRGSVSASDEFVELYNPTTNPISLAGWRLEYLSATGTSWNARLTFPSTAVIQANSYYLTANPAGYVVPNSGPLPDSNWSSTTGIADDGHIRIVDSTGKEIDRVGYGSASQPEGGTPGAPNHGTSADTKSVARSTISIDTNINRNDFIVLSLRNPRNSYSLTQAKATERETSSGTSQTQEQTTTSDPSPPSFAQKFSHPKPEDLAIRDIFVYPNPVFPAQGQKPTFRLNIGKADRIELRIYTIAGELLHSANIPENLVEKGGEWVYEYSGWDISSIASGVYIYLVRAERAGFASSKALKKLAIIK